MKALALLSFVALAIAVPAMSQDSFKDIQREQVRDVATAIVIAEVIFAIVPLALFWQWYDLAMEGPSRELSSREKRYYSTTVFLFAALFVAIWYLLPYRSIVGAADLAFFPIFSSPDASARFVDSTRAWVENQSNWAWLAIPITLIALPYARLVGKTPPFVRSRGGTAQSALEAAGRGISYGLYYLSRRIQILLEQTIDVLRRTALTLNRTLADFIDRGTTFCLNLADITYRLTALAGFVLIALALLVPGVAMGNFVLTIIGLLMLGAILLAMVAALLKPRNEDSGEQEQSLQQSQPPE